ncbi:SRPBCC domain-containing protein [Spongiibacter nanhainus]|uniref:SRPBCC domain-containing protein n=1 Tax=Spongiibacter nanhainus TaxID=2794344 RepID=A0A7T4URA3_9GAMM|nr:SRPBCC domain-containing protein [Spongiibacter nanhainus]QQD19521.1 SRPBCC domain-containing protein [Spongiibacter nanhainus]
MTMAYASAETIIQAPIERVWEVMLDIDRYQQWNPFVTHIECADTPPRLGSDLTLHVRFSSGLKRREIEQITCLEPPQDQGGELRATLVYRFTGLAHDWNLVRGQRYQYLTALSDTSTRYFTEENLTGWLSWVAPIRGVRDGFERHAQALKERCESLPV